jgi:hypothetical protein
MGLVGATPTDLRPSPATPLATTPYHKKLQMFLSTTKGLDSPHTVISGTLLGNRAKSVTLATLTALIGISLLTA